VPIPISNRSQLPPDIQSLIEKARLVMPRAYHPYSTFYVGAAALTNSKSVHCGTFLENASLGLTICAEAAALSAANSAGDLNVRAIAVVGGASLTSAGPPVTPCGRCRQLIFEISQVAACDIAVYCCNADLSRIVLATISELLPLAFGPADVGKSDLLAEYRRAR
jgi:cytidine deaminase